MKKRVEYTQVSGNGKYNTFGDRMYYKDIVWSIQRCIVNIGLWMKKNGVSTGIDIRSSLTGQVTGTDKNGRQSDLENAVLVSLGMTNTLREFNGPRSDDMVMKREMLNEINQQGYVTINSLTNDVTNKTTLNTVNTYLLGMGIKSDLVTKGLMIKQTLKEDI